MINIKMNRAKTSFNLSSLTQAVNMGNMDLAMATPQSSATEQFTHTMMASSTSSALYVMGDGSFDPTRLTRIFINECHNAGIDSAEGTRALRDYLTRWAINPELFRAVVAAFTGSSSRGVRANSIRSIPATMIRDLVVKLAPADMGIFTEILTDWLTSVFSTYHWVSTGYKFVYEVRAPRAFPRYEDMCNIVASHDIRRMLESLGGIDKSVIANHILGGKTAVSVGLISQELSHGVSDALRRVKGSHTPELVVDAALLLAGQAWTPATSNDDTLAPRSILESDTVALFTQNLAMFLMYQERLVSGTPLTLEYDYSIIKSDILPLIREAITEISPYKIRPISEVVAHLSKSSVKDYLGVPSLTMIYENITFPEAVTAFTRTQIDQRSKHRLLSVDSNISEQMSSALIPVTNQFSIEKMVAQKYHTAELIQPDKKTAPLGSETTLLLPSFLERMPADTDIMGTWDKVVESYSPFSKRFSSDATDEQKKKNVEDFGPYWKEAGDVIYDHYKYLVHFAVYNVNDVRVNAYDEGLAGPYSLALQFTTSTDLKTPIGRSQIVGGIVSTMEPLEVLQYVKDVVATEKLQAKQFDLSVHEEDGLHAWDWKAQSTALDFETTYRTLLRGTSYSVDVDMRHLLGLTMARRNVRFLNNRLASVTVKLWFTEIFSQISDIERQIKSVSNGKKGDEVKRATYEAQLAAFNNLIANQLIAIGGTSMGEKGISFIKHSIQREMFDLGSLDDYTYLHVGVQATLMKMWMGLTTLEYLNLLGQDDIQKLTKHIKESEVLSHVIANANQLENHS